MTHTKPTFKDVASRYKPPVFTLHVTANYPGDREEDYGYQTRFEVDDLLGIIKTYMEFADKASSFVFTVVKESADAATERLVEEDRLRAMGQWDHEEGVDR